MLRYSSVECLCSTQKSPRFILSIYAMKREREGWEYPGIVLLIRIDFTQYKQWQIVHSRPDPIVITQNQRLMVLFLMRITRNTENPIPWPSASFTWWCAFHVWNLFKNVELPLENKTDLVRKSFTNPDCINTRFSVCQHYLSAYDFRADYLVGEDYFSHS